MSKQTLTAEIKLRLAPDEKERLKQIADDAGLTMSELVRSVIFSERKVVFLVKGAEIAASMFHIRTDLDALRSEGVIPASEIDRLQNAIEGVGAELSALTEQLSDVHTDNEEADDNG